MGSGGSQTLWPPSNEACVAGGVSNRCTLKAAMIIRSTTPGQEPRAVIDGGTHQARIGQLVSVSSMRYRTSTSDLSRSWSPTVLRNLILREASRLDAFSGYPVHA